MPFDLLIAFIGFAFVTSVTPGPNNLMLMTSGINFGFRRTLPHLSGIAVGFMVMVALVGLGFGQVFSRFPALYTLLKVVGAAYLLWLAWKIARSGPVGEGGQARGEPIGFLAAAAFQWVNPKAWTMTVGAIATYTMPENYAGSLAAIIVIYLAVGTPCSAAWAASGAGLRGFLSDPRMLRAFNLGMAVLLVLSLWPVAAELFG